MLVNARCLRSTSAFILKAVEGLEEFQPEEAAEAVPAVLDFFSGREPESQVAGTWGESAMVSRFLVFWFS